MHFTLVFESDESQDRSYGLVFIPSPVWVQGNNQLLKLTGGPHYQRGGLEPLLRQIGALHRKRGSRQVVCVVHPSGHGTQSDFDNLKADLADASFEVTLVEIGAPA